MDGSLVEVASPEQSQTIEDAIAAAAAQLPPEKVEPRQPPIPGLTPVFNVAAALDSIEAQERTATDAERRYTSANDRAKQLRKTADEENAQLRTLIRELNERRHDGRYEPKESDGNSGESDGNISDGSCSPDGDQPTTSAELSRADGNGPGKNLHDLGEPGSANALPVAEAGSEPADSQPHNTLEELQHLLAQAGAITGLDTIASWTRQQYDEASAWAEAQIAANERAKPGHTVSVRWPDHVSAAHHEGASDR